MKFHPPHVSPKGHEFSIGDNGLHVQIQFAKQTPLVLTSEEAMELRSWLDAAELRTQDQHDKIAAHEKANPTVEKNSGTKVEMNDHTVTKDGRIMDDGTHKFAQTPEELATLQAEAAKNLADQQAKVKAAKK